MQAYRNGGEGLMGVAKAVQASYNWRSFTEREGEREEREGEIERFYLTNTPLRSLTHNLSSFAAQIQTGN